MVKNVIKGSFPISFQKLSVEKMKIFVRLQMVKNISYFKSFSVIATSVEKMKILDYFMIANGKEGD